MTLKVLTMRDKKLILKVNFFIFLLFFVLNSLFISPKFYPITLLNEVRGKRFYGNEEPFKVTTKQTVEDEENADNIDIEKKWKKIVFWTEYFGKRDLWYKVFKRLLVSECEESRCHVILNEAEVKTADAVIFNGNDLRKNGYSYFEKRYEHPIYKRRENQIYVFFSMEAPPMFQNIRLQDYDNFFNWTMTYRKDSDVVVPYGAISKRKQKRPSSEIKYLTDDELKAKAMAFWMVSHCPTQSKREDFVKELRRLIKIDSYGTCGKLKCGERRTILRVNELEDDPCMDLYGNYSFYMALENSLCNDYVTEKLYRSLKIGIVPIVLGAVNYTEFAPPNSYIDAKEFTTYIDLGNHIKTVASDAKLYNDYLKWQEEYDVEIGSPYKPMICDLCKKLHKQTPDSPKKSYKSIKEWFIKQGPCYKFTD